MEWTSDSNQASTRLRANTLSKWTLTCSTKIIINSSQTSYRLRAHPAIPINQWSNSSSKRRPRKPMLTSLSFRTTKTRWWWVPHKVPLKWLPTSTIPNCSSSTSSSSSKRCKTTSIQFKVVFLILNRCPKLGPTLPRFNHHLSRIL